MKAFVDTPPVAFPVSHRCSWSLMLRQLPWRATDQIEMQQDRCTWCEMDDTLRNEHLRHIARCTMDYFTTIKYILPTILNM